MDSRAYLFIFPIEKPGDIPADFQPSLREREFQTGIFLPQDDSNWFTRPPAFPARLLLLNGRCLSIVPHPTANEAACEINLDDLIELEIGNILLLGWIGIRTEQVNIHLPYNTRASRALDTFLEKLRQEWFPKARDCAGEPFHLPSLERQIKFRFLLTYSLDPGERALSMYFCPAVEFQDKFLLFKRINWHSGHLIAVTSRDRLLWLTDEYKGRCERYAAITISAPLSRIRGCEVKPTGEHEELVLEFLGKRSWHMPTCSDRSEALRFSHWLSDHMSRKAPAKHAGLCQ